MIDPTTIELRSGQLLGVRSAEAGDASELVRHFQTCAGESEFLSFGPGEYDRSIADETRRIQAAATSSNQLYDIGSLEGAIVASVVVTASARPRRCHVGEFGVVVRRDYWGLGIGTAMLTRMLAWAEASSLAKLNLQVRADNHRALGLYRRLGFRLEGRLRKELFDGTRYHDVHVMSIMLARQTHPPT